MLLMMTDRPDRPGADTIADWIRHTLHGAFDNILDETVPPEILEALTREDERGTTQRRPH